MNVCLVMDYRFVRFADGTICSPTAYSYEMLRSRYLSVFESLTLFVRVDDHQGAKPGWAVPVEGPGVRVVELRSWKGVLQASLFSRGIQRSVLDELTSNDALVVMAPGVAASALLAKLKGRRPFALEVISDPSVAFGGVGLSHPLRKAIAYKATSDLIKWCQTASVVSYVTSSYLQERYPSRRPELSFGVSDVVLSRSQISSAPRGFRASEDIPTILAIGSLANRHKGIDILIQAVAELSANGVLVDLRILGDGGQLPSLRRLATKLGVERSVRFLGHVSDRSAVFDELDSADIFAMPSRTEGFPRAMVEAMARGLPVVASRVGGIPELVGGEQLVEPGNVGDLAKKIQGLLQHPELMRRLSEENLEKAAGFTEEVLSKTRRSFYLRLRSETERWITSQS